MGDITTPYLREIVFLDKNGCSNEPEFNHDFYDIFMLKSRLLPFIHEYLGKNYSIYFPYREELYNMRAVIRPILGQEVVPLTEQMQTLFQEKVNEELSLDVNHVLIFNTNQRILDKQMHMIPLNWLKQIIRFVDVVPQKYQPVLHNNNLYADLSKEIEYNDVYASLAVAIYTQIKHFYERGYVVDAENLEKSWELERVDGHMTILEGTYVLPKLWRPRWTDKRFAPYIVDFLLERGVGKKFINVNVGFNNVIRHYISIFLNSKNVFHYYQDKIIFIEVENYTSANKWTNFCYDSFSKSNGKVLTLAADRLSWIKIYSVLSSSFWPTSKHNTTIYVKKDILPTFVFSSEVPIITNLERVVDQFTLRARRMLLFLKNQHKVENIHELIEGNNYIFPKELVRDIDTTYV